ncbi:DUF6252 family protein [Gaopeijia maritima]|uniref:DUF6252 family protein n=1 Tax=Gaopeijia maritima TaxID=3119007 RepID=UPI00325127CA
MRAFLQAAFVAVGMSLSLVGCGDEEPTGPGALSGSMTASVDGQAWSAIQVSAGRSGADVIGLGGTSAAQTTISLSFTAAGPGTYAIPQTGMNFNFAEFAGGALWQALGIGQLGAVGSGSVTITTLSATRIVGTFHFRAPPAGGNPATADKVVTQGAFDIPIASN